MLSAQLEQVQNKRLSPKRLRDSIVQAIKIGWRASPAAFIGICVSSTITALIPATVLALTKHLVTLVQDSLTRPMAFSVVMPTVIGLGLLAGGQRALGQLDSRRQILFADRVAMSVQRRFLEQVARADLGHFDDPDWHDRVARASRDVNNRPYSVTFTTIGLGSSFVTILGMFGLLFSLDWRLLPLAIVSVGPTMFVNRKINRRRYAFRKETTADDREADYIKELLSKPRTSKEIRSLNIGSHLIERWQVISDSLYARLKQLYHSILPLYITIGLVGGAALAAAYGLVASSALGRADQFAALAVVTGAFVSVSQQALSIVSSFTSLDENAQFLSDYFEFLEIEPLIRVVEPRQEMPPLLTRGIEFDDVSLTYPMGTEPALDGVTFAIEPGELMALVGDNGAGKTTIIKMLLRFYDPSHGSVRVGGVDLRHVDPAELRERIGVLFQDFATYELSVRENVTLGRPDKIATDADVEESLRAARADWLVKRLPRGLDSKVGRLFEGGHDLSGGEWQRLALARLIYRDADIWILDEPTSSLDPEAEAAIFAELRENLRGRIGIVISHRFSTVRIADRIAVVQDGRITEAGTHEELLALNGRYAHLFELQAAGYR